MRRGRARRERSLTTEQQPTTAARELHGELARRESRIEWEQRCAAPCERVEDLDEGEAVVE